MQHRLSNVERTCDETDPCSALNWSAFPAAALKRLPSPVLSSICLLSTTSLLRELEWVCDVVMVHKTSILKNTNLE